MSFQPKWASAPGDTIKEILEVKEISRSYLSRQMGCSELFVENLIGGYEPVTDAVAKSLSGVLGASVEFWLNREEQFRQDLVRVRQLQRESWLQGLPLKDMIKFGWISSSNDMFTECLRFFDVADIASWRNRFSDVEQMAAFRTSSRFLSHVASTAAWIRQGEIEAGQISCSAWNPKEFLKSLSSIKRLTRKKNPADFIPALREICSEHGVAVVVVRAPSGCTASGATKFLNPTKAMLMLSFRYLSDDQFWFTFFHEAGHLVLHDPNQTHIETALIKGDQATALQEQEANSFASEMLVPYSAHAKLKRLKGKREILGFAIEHDISAGIVIGQMQHYQYIQMNQLNGYKRRYEWEELSKI